MWAAAAGRGRLGEQPLLTVGEGVGGVGRAAHGQQPLLAHQRFHRQGTGSQPQVWRPLPLLPMHAHACMRH